MNKKRSYVSQMVMMITLLGWGSVSVRAVEEAEVRGKVRGEARAAGRDVAHGPYSDRQLKYAVRFDYSHLKNVIVYAEPIPDTAPPVLRQERLTIGQTSVGLSATPAFQAIPLGGGVTFRNGSLSALSLYAAGDSAMDWELDVPRNGEVTTSFMTAGLYRLRCQEDPAWRADILVAGRYVAPADAEGAYTFHLPPGRYRVTAWHSRIPPQSRELDLKSHDTQTLDFTLTVKGLPEVP